MHVCVCLVQDSIPENVGSKWVSEQDCEITL